MTLIPWLMLIVAVIAALAWWKRDVLRRAIGSGGAEAQPRGLTSKTDAQALFQDAMGDNLARIHQAKEALEGTREMLESVRRQVESGQREKTRLEFRISAALADGDPNHAAREYALQLAEVEKQLAINRQQLAQHEATYRKFDEQVEAGQKRLLETRRRGEQLGMALEQSQREREMAELTSHMNSEDMQARASSAEERVYQEIDRNRAAGRVAADLAGGSPAPIEPEEAEREAEADKILDRFAKPGQS
jgi:phage shock protein A